MIKGMILEGGHRVVTINGREIDPAKSQAVINHSPDGFNWGYGGSGPAQLALGILLELYPRAIALRYYQKLKNDIIARIPIDKDFSIPTGFITAWMRIQKL